jgi:excisionase family DNA binding protein
MENAMEELLTAKEVGKILKIHPKTVINLIVAKKLKATMVGVQYRVSQDDLKEYIKSREV